MNHFQYSKLSHPDRPCTAQDETFGERCMNWGASFTCVNCRGLYPGNQKACLYCVGPTYPLCTSCAFAILNAHQANRAKAEYDKELGGGVE